VEDGAARAVVEETGGGEEPAAVDGAAGDMAAARVENWLSSNTM
jgi:hypothetical protein